MGKKEQGGDSADHMEIGRPSSFARLASMETPSSKRFSETRLSFVRPDEVSIDMSALQPATSASLTVQLREGDPGAFSTGHAMLELSFAVSEEHVTLQSLTPMDDSEVPFPVENETWEGRSTGNDLDARRPSRPMPISSSSCHSGSFRESMRTVGTLVKQLGNDLARSSRNASRVQDLGSPCSESGFLDPELDNPICTGMQKSTSSRAEYAIKGLRYINKATATADQKKSWEQVEARFHKLANLENMLHRSDFAECIGMKDSKEFANELFDALVRRQGVEVESIGKDELYLHWLQIADKSFDARMQLFFDLCDKDLDGRITGEEVKQLIMLSASANKLSKLKDQAAEYAALIMEGLHVDGAEYITLSQLKTLMSGSVQGFGRETTVNNNQTLTPKSKRSRMMGVAEKSAYFLLDNCKRIWILALWISVMVGLFAWKFLQYRNRSAWWVMGDCLCVAKGAAETLKLNMALILLPVCRNTITRLRSTRLRRIIPFDDNLDFHKIVAGGIAAGVILHATCHITCDIPRFVEADKEKFFKYLGDDFDFQPTYSDILRMSVGYSGLIMVVLMILAFLLATHWFRQSLVKLPWPFHRLTGFNAFWYSHHLFAIVYAFLLLHGSKLLLPNSILERSTWIYIAVPLVLYAGERFLRMYRTNSSKVDVIKAAIYTGNVLAIHMSKPEGFKYKSGMYLFLQCPEISSFEWHPFSITSAPEDPFLSVHIRTLGDWTAELKRIFSDACGGRMRLQTVNNYGLSGELTLAARFPKLYIDGPYGAPAQDYLNYDVLLLVGLGIGATPFISILKDLLHHTINESLGHSDPSLTPDLRPMESPRTRSKKKAKRNPKAYFYWMTREQGSFDWFRGVMREVEEIDHKGSIEMHNYLTSVYEEGDARSTLVIMLQALHHAKNGVDLVSGTRARTHFARPNWKSVFSKLAATHQEKRIGVFYCGPVTLANELENLSRTYTQKSSTKFSFHKENF
ncbi:respiratory burst oxidase homolog protein B [Physcomitrium patens]|uniref:Uncharacterized protein n=1 Tax=Physcomitrium patens TaxID=3218 RepID=A0A2K1K0B8_PHYPA|nr:respiratory burst oxidase homolog protein B-like [Physcomitrium patens]PNR47219.1 hypothetical protein PHYPA_014339 [Physcomitrium patens]|eukprot:XP_024385792.1 respiratory burst oxidase homolog protein B-like [Physcomitrella patens]